MATNVSKKTGDTTFTFMVTGSSIKVDPILEKWAEYVYGKGFGTITTKVDEEDVKTDFADLTNQQKLNAINVRIKALGLAEANTQENDDIQAAKEAERVTHDLTNID